MSSFRHLGRVFLLSFVLLVRGKNDSDEQHCADKYCEAYLTDDSDANNHLERLCEPPCEEALETSLRVAHLNYDHVRVAFGSSILIMVVIFAKLCK